MTERRASRTVLPLVAGLLLLGHAGGPAVAQEPEVIVLDPNHPLIQNPQTVQPEAGPAAAPRPAGPEGPVAIQGVNAREILDDLWFRYRALMSRGAAEDAGQAITSALDFMRRQGLRALPEIAAAFGADARKSLREGDYRRAGDVFDLAARFDPDAPGPQFGLATVRLRGERDPWGALVAYVRGWRLSWSDPGTVYAHVGNASLLFYLGLCGGGILALTLLSLRSAPALAHDLRERSRGKMRGELAGLLAFVALAAPILLFLPVLWLPAIWGALLYPYFGRGERVVVMLALGCMALAGPAGWALDWSFRNAADPGARILLRSVRGIDDLQQEEALERLVREQPGEPMFPFLLGARYRALGRIDEAIAMYRRVLTIDPAHARAMVNLANLHALRREQAQALNLYHKAAEADPKQVLAHYDAALLHHEALHLEAAEAELKEARAIDEALVTRLRALEAGPGRSRREPVDAAHTATEIWKRALALGVKSGPVWSWPAALAAPGTLAGSAGLLAALLVPGLGIGLRGADTRRCRRCGRAFCRHCQVVTKRPDHCSQCMHLFILRDGLAPGVKQAKLQEVERHSRRVWIGERLLSLILPGGGHVLGGRAALGALLLAAWCVVWLGIRLRGDLVVTPEWLATAAGAGGMVLFFGVGLIVWLVGNLTSHERTGA